MKPLIPSSSPPAPFEDRIDAANALASRLMQYRGRHPLILGIPRGGVPLANALAQRLDGDLDVVLAHKISAPAYPEYAIGAIDETGWSYLLPDAFVVGATEAYIEQEKARQLAIIKQRRAKYTGDNPSTDPARRIVIVVDDGLATGSTMIAALHAVRAKHPSELICAVPVGAPDNLEHIKLLADKVICLHAPADFSSVGQFYRNFAAVDDDEVMAILRRRKIKSKTDSGSELR